MRTAIAVIGIVIASAIVACGSALAMRQQISPSAAPPAPTGLPQANEPFILYSGGDTTWIEVQDNSSYCPGDPNLHHGGEATGGPGPLETWCFEGGPLDSCGTNPPWDTNCFRHVDVRSLPSQMNINYWHVDTYRADQRPYCGGYALWCGSSGQWDGQPVECGTWASAPGYGDQWTCIAQLTLDAGFDVAGGCTVYFDPRYDLECKYDYFYIDYLSRGPAPTLRETWKTLAMFNGTSNTTPAVCGLSGSPNPDYFSNGDQRGPGGVNGDWQERSSGLLPAFKRVITPANFGTLTEAPKFRWRVESDGGGSDADGNVDTDGAAFLDNVIIRGDNPAGPGNASIYTEDFESGVLDVSFWSLPDPEGKFDFWHITGGGLASASCVADTSYMYRARPDAGWSGREDWFYRLMTPTVALQNSGCVTQYDIYQCVGVNSCESTNRAFRVYDGTYGKWCPWINPWYPVFDGCLGPWYDVSDDLSSFISATAESIQFGWELLDFSEPWNYCPGHHSTTELLVDNVSIGFYDAEASEFSARGIDLLQDSFLEDVGQAYNSFFDVYDPDTVARYSGPGAAPLPKTRQLYLDCTDSDGVVSVKIVGSVNGGGTWIERNMALAVPRDPQYPELGGEYYGTLTAWDFNPGATAWDVGSEVWYYVKATDELSNVEYFPATADPGHPSHTGGSKDYFEFSILPIDPDSTDVPKILLVDGNNIRHNDWSPCLSVVDREVVLETIYAQTLTDAGYCFDRFDISGAGTGEHIQPIWLDDYDAVVWFTGPDFSDWLFDPEAQYAIRDYLAAGGKVVLCGDRIAYSMAVAGWDSLNGEFLGGIMGATYQEEKESGETKPYLYMEAADSLTVFGSRIGVDLSQVLVYSGCPDLKDMSYVVTNASPPVGYTAQMLLDVTNPGVTYPNSDGAIYVEYQNQGQCVFVDFDLCAMVNHTVGYCDGNAALPAPDFVAGTYDGRVELVTVILEDIFGLPSNAGGAAVPGPKDAEFEWVLGQNTPNPCRTSTSIAFSLAEPAHVAIKVYNAAGQLVRTIVDEQKAPGHHTVAWDGTTQSGERVSSGVYFYMMEAADYKATKKMLVVQ